MTTPPIEPPAPEPVEPGGSVPPQIPPGPDGATPPQPAPRYETKTLVIAAVVTVVVLSVLTALVPPLGLAAPLVLVMALFFIRRDATAHRRSIVTGVILGAGIGLLTTAGICVALLNSASTL